MEDYDNDPVLNKYKFPTPARGSDAKRLAALDSKFEQEKASKELIKSALSGKLVNKKIIFDNPVSKKQKKPEPEPEPSLASKKLFDDYDDGDENESFKLDIPSSRFNSSKDSKIIQLQSRFAHDPRFKIDDKFVEDDEDSSFPKRGGNRDRKTDDDSDDLNKEKEKDLDILEEVLGKPLKRKYKHPEEKQVTRSIIIPRYDPTKPESQKFKIRKVDKLEPYQLPNEEEDEPMDKPEVSKKRFYEISETFKKDFDDEQNDGQAFSLTAMFGRPAADIPEISAEVGTIKEKRSKSHDTKTDDENFKKSKKKFESAKQSIEKVDSSEEDSDSDSKGKKSKSKKKSKEIQSIDEKKSIYESSGERKPIDLKSIKSNKSKVSNPLLKYERFFFADNDGRLTSNSFYNVDRIKTHTSSWKEKKVVMSTALTKKRRHFKHVSKLKSALETGDSRDKDLRTKYRVYKETTKKH